MAGPGLALSSFGAIHLFATLFALYQLGPVADRQLGKVRMVLVYAASGLMGALAADLARPYAASVGASGAILGLYGALLARAPIRRGELGWLWRLLPSLLLLLVVNLLPARETRQIDYATQLGGFVTGLLLGYLLAFEKHEGSAKRFYLASLTLLGITGMGMLCLTGYPDALAALASLEGRAATIRAAENEVKPMLNSKDPRTMGQAAELIRERILHPLGELEALTKDQTGAQEPRLARMVSRWHDHAPELRARYEALAVLVGQPSQLASIREELAAHPDRRSAAIDRLLLKLIPEVDQAEISFQAHGAPLSAPKRSSAPAGITPSTQALAELRDRLYRAVAQLALEEARGFEHADVDRLLADLDRDSSGEAALKELDHDCAAHLQASTARATQLAAKLSADQARAFDEAVAEYRGNLALLRAYAVDQVLRSRFAAITRRKLSGPKARRQLAARLEPVLAGLAPGTGRAPASDAVPAKVPGPFELLISQLRAQRTSAYHAYLDAVVKGNLKAQKDALKRWDQIGKSGPGQRLAAEARKLGHPAEESAL